MLAFRFAYRAADGRPRVRETPGREAWTVSTLKTKNWAPLAENVARPDGAVSPACGGYSPTGRLFPGRMETVGRSRRPQYEYAMRHPAERLEYPTVPSLS